MNTDKATERRLKRLTEHPDAYIASWKRDFDDAFSRDTWFSTRDEKEFAKALRSQDPLSGYSSLLIARRRSTFLCYEGQRRVLNGDSQGWALIDRAYDNIWWAFRGRPYSYGDYESLVQLLLPLSSILGYCARAEFIGRYLYDRTEGSGAERYLEHSSVGRLVVQLWAKNAGLPLETLGEFREFPNSETGYPELVALLWEPDSPALSLAVRKALDFHVLSAASEEGELRTAILFHALPIEVLYLVSLRRARNLSTRIDDHPIWSNPLSRLPENLGFLGAIPDPVLRQAIAKAVSQKFFTWEDVENYQRRNGRDLDR